MRFNEKEALKKRSCTAATTWDVKKRQVTDVKPAGQDEKRIGEKK